MPKAAAIAAPPAGALPMMLGELDLPPVAGVVPPVGRHDAAPGAARTSPRPACDESSFHGPGWRHDATRSFLVPGAHLADGVRADRDRRAAAGQPRRRAFVNGVRSELARARNRQLGTKVLRLAARARHDGLAGAHPGHGQGDVTFYMGVVRAGGAVAQVGFVPDGRHSMTTRQFLALVRRAGERLGAMPG